MKLPDAKDIAEYMEMMENIHELSVEYFHSPRFKQVIYKIKKEVDKYGSVSDNPNKDYLFSDVTNEDLAMIFAIVFDPDLLGLEIIDFGDSFWQESVIFEDLEFTQIYGNDVVFIVRRVQ